MRIGTWTLTKRGERVMYTVVLTAFIFMMGFVGWLENLGM